jgi:SAM-dependent methyltransferase
MEMKVLAAIANHGTKNAAYLDTLLKEFRSMGKYDLDVVVHSDIPKNLGPDIEVVVGLPAKDPRSLPFAHKALFADRMGKYDLYVYSEDDILIKERNIDAFVEATHTLPDGYIAGFLRFERRENGRKYYPDFHNRFHWDPHSVQKIGEDIFAHHTNQHSACFILTQDQLEQAVDSGGFLSPPRKGRYDMLETAATDPYTQCGMKKLICISRMEDFLIHHLPNVYIDKLGLDEDLAEKEIEKLKSLLQADTVRGPLFDTGTLLESAQWEKKYYEPCREDILSLIPEGVRRVLSVGCSCGSTESELVKQGVEVVGIPMDCIVQATVEAKGVKAVSPDIDSAMDTLRGEGFDCILFPDVLQHFPDPVSVAGNFLALLRKRGTILVSAPNFHYPAIVREKWMWKDLLPNANGKHAFGRHKIHFTTRSTVDSWMKRCGLKAVRSSRHIEPGAKWFNRMTMGIMKSNLSRNVVVLYERANSR